VSGALFPLSPATARANFVAFGPNLDGYPGFTDQ